MPFTGCCPVRNGKRIKYFIVFASRHHDAMILMNDNMANAYFKAEHKAIYGGTLFQDIDWKDMPATEDRAPGKLNQIILDLVAQNPNLTRDEIWLKLIQEHFMCFVHGEYLNAVKSLAENQKLLYPKDAKTGRHNGSCKLQILKI